MKAFFILLILIVVVVTGGLFHGLFRKEDLSLKNSAYSRLFNAGINILGGICICGSVYTLLSKTGYLNLNIVELTWDTIDWFALMLFMTGVFTITLMMGMFVAICRNWGMPKYLSSLNKKNWYSILICLGGGVLSFIGANLYMIYAKDSVVINEVCSDNFSVLQDSFGNFCDYIELYNPSNTEVSLAGYVLSDDEKNLDKYTVGNVKLGPKEYLIIHLNGNTETEEKDNLQAPFRLNSSGEVLVLSNNSGQIIDTVSIPWMDYDCSLSRMTDGEYEVLQCTPGRGNFLCNEGTSLSFSIGSGFYEEPFYLDIVPEKNGRIFYTLDGSTPDETSIEYKEPIWIEDRSKEADLYSDITGISNVYEYNGYEGNVDKANIVRAVAYYDDGEISPVLTQVYFVGFEDKYGYEGIPCISIAITPEDMFGDQRGIYTLGDSYEQYLEDGGDATFSKAAANYNQRGKEWERQIHFSYFNETHELEFEQECGIRIQGDSKRNTIQKNFNIICRNKYGNAYFEESFFGDDDRISNIILRSSMYVVNDAIPYELVKDNSIGIQSSQSCAVFINGEYWGLYLLQEKYVPSYFEEHFAVEPDNLILLKNGELEEGKREDISSYKELLNFVKANDLSINHNYEYVCEQIDVQNYIEYLCTQVYVCNMDYCENKNMYMWRAREQGDGEFEDGKWRWLLYDMDFSAGSGNSNAYTINSFSDPMPWCIPQTLMEDVLFKEMMQSELFKEQFVLTFMDMANYNFNSQVVLPLVESYEENLKEAYVASNRRFSNRNYSEQDFSLQRMKEFYENRSSYITGHLAEEFLLSGDMNILKVTLGDESKGKVKVNSLTIEDKESWEGSYFGDYSITVQAIPKEGYIFKGWSGDIDATEELIKVDMSRGMVEIHPVFEIEEEAN